MKKALAIIMVLPMLACAQVAVVSPPQEMERAFAYDSLTNVIEAKHIQAYIGQQLQFLPPKYDMGYTGIYGYNKGKKTDERPQREELEGKVFTIVDYKTIGTGLTTSYYLILQNPTTKKEYFYVLATDADMVFSDIILLGYQEKFVRTHKDKIYVWKGPGKDLQDMEVSNKVPIKPNECLKFHNLIYNTKERELGYQFTDMNGSMVYIGKIDFKLSLLEKEKYDEYIARFDEASVRRAMAGDYWVGMNEDLLFLSQGYPDHTNHTSYNKQHVYRTRSTMRCFYVEGGKVTAWN
jgi:hypothetical protein